MTGEHLTPRECQVLVKIASGRTAKETARELNISPRTVEAHVAAIKTKLSAHTKTDMILKAQLRGLIIIEKSPGSPSRPVVRLRPEKVTARTVDQ